MSKASRRGRSSAVITGPSRNAGPSGTWKSTDQRPPDRRSSRETVHDASLSSAPKGGPVTWEGKTRASLFSQDVVPHLDGGPLPVWIGVGGNPQSVIRAARLGFSLALAIIGGPPSRFAAYSQLFQRALEKSGRAPLPVLVHSPGHVAPTDEQAKAEFWPRWRDLITVMAAERGFAIPAQASFDAETGPDGA